MSRSDLWKLVLVVVATIAAAAYLLPSYQYYSMTPAQRDAKPPQELADLRKRAIHLGLDLQGGLQLLLEVDKSHLSAAESKDATDRAMEIIRNRVDQFGVAEPLIQREGEDRIAVQMPGLTDRTRAIELIGKTALLEFKLVRTPDEAKVAFERLDSYLSVRQPAGTDSLLTRHPLTGRMLEAGFVRKEDVAVVEKLLASAPVDTILPSDTQIVWGNADVPYQGITGREIYVLKREPEMTGGSIASAMASNNIDQVNPGAWGVKMEMTPKGRSDFARVTGANVGRALAIVLDGVVQSAPRINDKIPGGSAQITGGSFTIQTANDLAIVLRAGALPAPVKILEERTVGPSLGNDSIHSGIMAGLIGTAMVIAFMIIYYQLSGVIAVFAMLLNTFYVVACLAGFGATLTLPGIAGLVLTVGMAVDTNVLIFERIREELRNGRSIRQAVELGYNRAFRTVFDAHSTAIISGLFLFQFGTGPIKGFAVTLITGLVANLFTAVLFTRMIYDYWLSRGKIERLSI
jgi:protein-export membrane protein SecD